MYVHTRVGMILNVVWFGVFDESSIWKGILDLLYILSDVQIAGFALD